MTELLLHLHVRVYQHRFDFNPLNNHMAGHLDCYMVTFGGIEIRIGIGSSLVGQPCLIIIRQISYYHSPIDRNTRCTISIDLISRNCLSL